MRLQLPPPLPQAMALHSPRALAKA